MFRLYHAMVRLFFFFNDTATTEIYTLSLHDALPISSPLPCPGGCSAWPRSAPPTVGWSCGTTGGTEGGSGTTSWASRDRKSTRLNSRHPHISYALFCLKKKKYVHQTPPAIRTRALSQ